MTETARLIRFENVGLRYGMGPEILKDVSFSRQAKIIPVPDRSIRRRQNHPFAFVVFSHCGPTRGLITAFGKDVTAISNQELPFLRRRIGVVFQDFRLLDHMTTYENVALPLRGRARKRPVTAVMS